MKLFLTFLFTVLFSYLLLGQSSYETPELREHIRQLDLAHARAIFNGDAMSLDSLMDDDVTVNHPTNRIVKEKKELLDLIKKRALSGIRRLNGFPNLSYFLRIWLSVWEMKMWFPHQVHRMRVRK